jgi:uncharacterized protein
MSFMARLASRMLGLPAASTSRLEYQVDLKIPMHDGVVLLANRVAPIGGESLPIILIRDPYTFRGRKPSIMAELIAERGYQVVYQNCRGRWGSGGEFQPFRNEREDGLATLTWLSEQPWFSGSVGMYGLSYWGYVQLALGSGAPGFLKALVPQMSASRVYSVFHPHDSLAVFTLLTWLYQTYVTNAHESPNEVRKANARRTSALQKGFAKLPAGEADEPALGFTSPFFQDVIRNEKPTDELWAAMDHAPLIRHITAPVHFVDGWYDFFLADQLADYASLRAAGREPYLTIGPWTHAEMPALKAGLKESFAWYDAHLRGNQAALRSSPVRVFVMGVNTWVDLPSWPPPSTATSWYVRSGGALSPEAPVDHPEPSRYRYDPGNPTPSIGGAIIEGGGSKNNRALEARRDVLTFTSQPMPQSTTIIGPVSVELYIRSTCEFTDFFARLCDVSPNGRKSMNICDGIVRLAPDPARTDGTGIRRVTIDLLSTAHCFKTGHRIRLQVSSGAYPMLGRNLGTGEPIATGTRMQSADQEVFHDASHFSNVVIPVVQTPPP